MDTISGPKDIIAAHNRIFEEEDKVAFGKFGARIGKSNIELLRTQLEDDQETYLYVIYKTKENYQGHRAPISAVSLADRLGAPAKHPDYGSKLVSFWIVISAPFESCNIGNLTLRSTGAGLVETVSRTMTSCMLVRES